MPIFKSTLAVDGPGRATLVGAVTALGVYAIYNQGMPNITDLRSVAPHNEDAEKARKHSALVSAALIGGVFLVARDINSYIISGIALIAIDSAYKHANAVNPGTGKVATDNSGQSISNVYPLPEYADAQ